MPDVVILNYNDYDTTISLVDRLGKYSIIDHICIVDNASTDDSYMKFKKISNNKVEVICTPKNGGYGYGNNFGIKYLYNKYKSENILLCNPDIVVEEDVIDKMDKFLKRNNDYLIAAPLMLNKYGVIQDNSVLKIGNIFCFVMSFEMIYSKLFKPCKYKVDKLLSRSKTDVEVVAGSLFMLNAKKMLKYALFDENIFLYCEEQILGMKCKKAGLKIALLPQCTFIHNHSVSINKILNSEVKKRKIMTKSALYVVKNYYKANFFEMLFAYIMMRISVFEIFLYCKIKSITCSDK